LIEQKIKTIMIATSALIFAAALLHYTGISFPIIGPILNFILCALALAGIAHIIGHSTEQLGNYLGAGITGVIQAAVASLPELFVCLFSLKAGLVALVQASLIGSILGNVLMLLGLAFIVGGKKHGVLIFEKQSTRMISTLLLLAVSALVLPTLAQELHLPAGSHEKQLATVCAIVLLFVFIVHTNAMLTQGQRSMPTDVHEMHDIWPLATATNIMIGCSVGAAFVSYWFVDALQPAIDKLGISQTFAGLVIVSNAGNAVENVVGVKLAAQGKSDFAVSIILNSALQIAVALIPILVLASFVIGGEPFTLAIPPILAVALFLSVLVVTVVTVDGHADMVDGAALFGLYVIIAAIFWWG
jgi:Ca2+:H+ antiporter